jgi:hypothetical protein
MGRLFASYRFSSSVADVGGTPTKSGGYIQDRFSDTGADGININNRLVIPPDKTLAEMEIIIDEAGGALVEPGSVLICSETGNLTPRKLRFSRASGGSVTIAVARRDLLAATVIAGRQVLGDVVCVELIGERIDDLYLELAPPSKIAEGGTPSRAPDTSGKYLVYSGVQRYQVGNGDGSFTGIFLPFRLETDIADAVPTILGSAFAGCVDVATVAGCGGRSQQIKHKRYTATMLTIEAAPVAGDPAIEGQQTTEVPISKYAASEILACGTALAALLPTICLAYAGEDDKRFDKRVA